MPEPENQHRTVGCTDIAGLLPFYLNRSLEKEETRRVKAHLAACAVCRREEHDTRIACDLFEGHLPVDLLLDFALEKPMPPGHQSIVESHLALCERCSEEVATVRQEHSFATALSALPNKDTLLEEIEYLGKIDPGLKRIEMVASEVAASESSSPASAPVDAETMVAKFTTCHGIEQRRRLGGREHRHSAFADAYLEHLDELRYDDVKQARQNTEAVVVKLIPRLPGPQSERMALMLRAIGVYASCHRQQGSFATAARALRVALSIARGRGLKQITAELLQRAAAVLGLHGRFSDAKDFLDQALVIYLDMDFEEGIGTVLVDRGAVLNDLGYQREAVDSLVRSLRLLNTDSLRASRNRLAAYQILATVYQALDDLKRAEDALGHAVVESKMAGRVNQATVLWKHGDIALTRGSYDSAEDSLRRAAELFSQLEDPLEAFVALSLTKVLLAQGKNLEAVDLAMSTAKFLMSFFRGNRVAEAAISDLVQIAVRGELTMGSIEKARKTLQTATDSPRHQPAR